MLLQGSDSSHEHVKIKKYQTIVIFPFILFLFVLRRKDFLI